MASVHHHQLDPNLEACVAHTPYQLTYHGKTPSNPSSPQESRPKQLNAIVIDVQERTVAAKHYPSSIPQFDEKPITELDPTKRKMTQVTQFLNNRVNIEGVQASVLTVNASFGVATTAAPHSHEAKEGLHVLGIISGAIGCVSILFTINSWLNINKLSGVERFNLVCLTVIQIVGVAFFLVRVGLFKLGEVAAAIGRIPVLDFIVNQLALAPIVLMLTLVGARLRWKQYTKNRNSIAATVEKIKRLDEKLAQLIELQPQDYSEYGTVIDASIPTVKFELIKERRILQEQQLSDTKLKMGVIQDIISIASGVLAIIAILCAAGVFGGGGLSVANSLNLPMSVIGCASTAYWAFRCWYDYAHPNRSLIVLEIPLNVIMAHKVEGMAEVHPPAFVKQVRELVALNS